MAKSKFVQFKKHANFFRHQCHVAKHDLNIKTYAEHERRAVQVCEEFEPLASKRFTYNDSNFYFESHADMFTFKIKNSL